MLQAQVLTGAEDNLLMASENLLFTDVDLYGFQVGSERFRTPIDSQVVLGT